MSMSSNRAMRAARLAAAALIAIGVAVPMTAVISGWAGQPNPGNTTPRMAGDATATPSTRQQLRCWQYGRLLFEENGFALSSDPAQESVRLRGNSTERGALIVVETGNATCLIRQLSTDRPAVGGRRD